MPKRGDSMWSELAGEGKEGGAVPPLMRRTGKGGRGQNYDMWVRRGIELGVLPEGADVSELVRFARTSAREAKRIDAQLRGERPDLTPREQIEFDLEMTKEVPPPEAPRPSPIEFERPGPPEVPPVAPAEAPVVAPATPQFKVGDQVEYFAPKANKGQGAWYRATYSGLNTEGAIRVRPTGDVGDITPVSGRIRPASAEGVAPPKELLSGGTPPMPAARGGMRPLGERGPETGGATLGLLPESAVKAAEHLGATARELQATFAPASVKGGGKEVSGMLRSGLGQVARRQVQLDQFVRAGERLFKSWKPEDVTQFIDHIETGSLSKIDPNLRQAAVRMRSMLDAARTEVQGLGTGKLTEYMENYFPHLWDLGGQKRSIFQRKPMAPADFLKERKGFTFKQGTEWRVYDKDGKFSGSYADEAAADAIAKQSGGKAYPPLTPVSWNPAEMTAIRVMDMKRYVMANQVMKGAESAGFATVATSANKAPEGWVKVGGAFKNYYMPEPAARIINNYLSPGLHGSPLYDGVRFLGNSLNQAQLGISAFHLFFTSADAMISKWALALKYGAAGMPLKALQKSMEMPIAPLENFLRGRKGIKEYITPGSTDPQTTLLIDALVKDGMRVRMDSFYKSGAWDKFRQDIHEKRLRGVLRAPFAIVDLLSKPLMEHIVPGQKVGVALDMARFELDRMGGKATAEELGAVLQKNRVWDSVDNRMGQMVYDNLFWNKTLKDLGMLGVRSLGWNLGTVREIGGGLLDVRKLAKGDLTHRTAYTVALPVVVGMMGAIMTYLYTGKGPEELRDYFYIKTGRKRPDGEDERVVLATYMKDVAPVVLAAKNAGVLGATGKLGTMAVHKVNPILSATLQMIQNEDFFGDQIRNANDPLVKQAEQEVQYWGKQLLPFSIQGAMQRSQAGGGMKEAAQSFVGVVAAPASSYRTAAEDFLNKEMSARRISRTPEESAKARIRQQLISKMRQGENPEIPPEFTKRQIANMVKAEKTDYLVGQMQRAPLEIAEVAWRKMTPEEKELVRPIFRKKIASHIGQLRDPEEQKRMFNLYQSTFN
jgi:hypothetical protein